MSSRDSRQTNSQSRGTQSFQFLDAGTTGDVVYTSSNSPLKFTGTKDTNLPKSEGERTSVHMPTFPETAEDAVDWQCETSFQVGASSKDKALWEPFKQSTYSTHSATQLSDGRVAVMLDIGSVGNLAGSEWVLRLARKALEHGRQPEQIKRDRPLSVCVVGK